MRIKHILLAVIVIVSMMISEGFCQSNQQKSETLATQSHVGAYQYTVPKNTNDGWDTAHLNTENINFNLIKELFDRINDNTYKNIHSVLLAKNGKLVVEEYFSGKNSDGQYQTFKLDTLHEMHSATKSVNSILIGIALDQHLITGVDEKVSAFFPGYADIFTNKEKDEIRLKHLLTMTAGLSWDEWTYPYTDPRNDAAGMASTSDFFRYVLEKPIATMPGTKFVYSSGISLTLGEIIHKVSGVHADKFADHYLFKPLGITEFYWGKAPNGTVNTLGGLALRPRDMAKIGYLF
jgi:CubicO group peptidase (beta-lactamase class C family)